MAKKNRVGILGGGQLAAMLGEAAKTLGLEPIALMSASEEPAFKVCRGSYLLQPNDAHPIHDFLSGVEVVAFENEFFPDVVAREAGADGRKFVPSFETIGMLRNKLRQKELFAKLEIATAPFWAMPSAGDVGAWVRQMRQDNGTDVVFKWAIGGYDGKGVCLSDDEALAVEFCRTARERNVEVFAEKRVRFKRELAIVCVRNTDGFFASYPLVISEQQNGICKWIKGPATAFGVDRHFEMKAINMAGRIAVATKLVGAFGLEFFEGENGELILNEVAPRVHNSGHYTQDAALTSQFVNHWQAILGVSLGDTTTSPAFAMVNLLGPAQEVPEVIPVALDCPDGIFYHDYGKRRSRPGRKMGHLNARADSVDALAPLLEQMGQLDRAWQSKVVRR